VKGKIDMEDGAFENLTNVLIEADLGFQTSENITNVCKKRVSMIKDIYDEHRQNLELGEDDDMPDEELKTLPQFDEDTIHNMVRKELIQIFDNTHKFDSSLSKDKKIKKQQAKNKPIYLLVCGVNGSGKTTTIGKLTNYYNEMGKNVSLIAADFTRAAAKEQLKVWYERSKADEFIEASDIMEIPKILTNKYTQPRRRSSSDENFVDNKNRLLILDTAGRLQTNNFDMKELKLFSRKINEKKGPNATFLVIDGTVGQNALKQVEAFNNVTKISGLIITKLDGTAKGGILCAIAERFKIPVLFIGTGEQIEDIKPFNAEDYVDSIIGPPPSELKIKEEAL